MTEPHLRRLMKRAKPLPERVAARTRLWRETMERAAPKLSDLLDTQVEVGAPTLALTTRDAVMAEGAAPGVLFPLVQGARGGQGGAWCVVPAEAALRLAACLLRAEPEADQEAPALLDALLLKPVIRALLGQVSTAFGVPLELDDGAPQLAWPLGGSESGPLLSVCVPLEANGTTMPVRLLLTEPDDFAEKHAPVAPSGTNRAALSCPLQVAAVLDSWTVSAQQFSRLKPGSLLPLPGASVEMLDVTVRSELGTLMVGKAELGRARGQRAVRLTEALPL